MPAKRIASKARAHRITPEAQEAYRLGDWPMLHRHLGLRPWEASPLDAEALSDPDSHGNGAWKASVPQAARLRSELSAEEHRGE